MYALNISSSERAATATRSAPHSCVVIKLPSKREILKSAGDAIRQAAVESEIEASPIKNDKRNFPTLKHSETLKRSGIL